MQYNSLNQLNNASSQKIVISRIKRIIEKYPAVWRIFHEPIQNAIDAIQQREDIKEGEINFKVHIATGEIIIQDNGKGFPQDLNLLLPDGTDKTEQSDTMGYQGVGLKSVIYVSDYFQVLSNLGNGQNWSIGITDAAKYLESEGETNAPINQPSKQNKDRGTVIKAKFNPKIIIEAIEQIINSTISTESDFKWQWDSNGHRDIREVNIFLKQAKQATDVLKYMLEYYLKTQTYIGSVNRLLNCRLKPLQEIYAKKIEIKLEIDFTNLKTNQTNNQFLQTLIKQISRKRNKKISLTLNNKYLELQQAISRVKEKKPRSVAFLMYDFDIKKAGIMNNPTLKDQVYIKIMTPNYTKTENNIEDRYTQYISLLDPGSEKRRERNINLFKDLFPKILGIYISIGRLEYYERFLGNHYGIKLIAANGIPTQHELTPRSSNQSFYNMHITFILNIDGKLNEGKTHLIDPTLHRKCIKFFREAFESTLNRLAKEFVKTVPNTTNISDVNLVNKPTINIKGLDIKCTPADENTLIALFYQLLKLKNLSLPTYGLLSQGIFDGKFAYNDTNVRSDNDLATLEFKVNLAALLNNFDSPNSPKEFNACDLIIVWDDKISTIQQQDWRVVNRSAVPSNSLRQINAPKWITTLLKDMNHQYKPIIIVKDWVTDLESQNT